MTKVLHNDIPEYDVVATRSNFRGTYEEAYHAPAIYNLESELLEDMLSSEGLSRPVQESPEFRKYIFEAYLDGLLVDRIVFVCRFR